MESINDLEINNLSEHKIDELIQSYGNFIDSTKKLKRGLMQTLLTRGIGHKKFKKVNLGFGKNIEFPEEWKIEKLKENASKIRSGITPSYALTQYHSDCAFTFNAAIPYTKAITESGG